MRLRATISLSVVLTLLATSAAAHAQETAQRDTAAKAKTALQIAREARKIANGATFDAATAQASANAAQTTADAARTAANAAQAALAAAAVESGQAVGTVTTAEENEYVSLGGPTATTTVGPSGLVEVWATVRFDDPSDGLVALYEDGNLVPMSGQDGFCSNGSPLDDVLLSAAGGAGIGLTLSTPAAALFPIGCGTLSPAPGPILLERSPGRHTYELRYADCGCEPDDASFSQRTLRVAARP